MTRHALRVGHAAEDRALRRLEAAGLRLLERNFRCRHGELDLVLTQGRTLVIVEVRYRRREHFGGAAASVDQFKRRRIVAATRMLLARNPRLQRRPVRFDVVAVGPDELKWIRGAFEAE